jgi:Fe-S-cluster containining protein
VTTTEDMKEKAAKHYMLQYMEGIKEGHSGPSLIHSFQKNIDYHISQAILERKYPPISCSKGCTGCCHIEVSVTIHEAELLLMFCEDKKIKIDYDRIKYQSEHEYPKMEYKDRSCVFLDSEGSCKVYEYRPMACRKYMVISSPDLCHTGNHPMGKVTVLSSKLAEIISATMASLVESDSLPKMLLKIHGDS